MAAIGKVLYLAADINGLIVFSDEYINGGWCRIFTN